MTLQSNRKPLGTASIKENEKPESNTFNNLQASGPRKKVSDFLSIETIAFLCNEGIKCAH
jgi:hypothetical protein